MSNNIKVTVIIPSYLEEENLRIIIPRLKKEMQKSEDDYEILIVDTMHAMDYTEDICTDNNVTYLNRINGNNYGDAVRTGIANANGEYIIFMDADGSHSPEFINKLYKYKDDYDVVIASRYIGGGATDNNRVLIFMSWVVNTVYSIVLNLKCKDVSNSFKLYRGNLLKNIDLYCDNFDIVEEILFKLRKTNNHLRIKEVPFSFKKRMFGETKRNLFLFMISYIFTLIKLRFGK
ncbi:MAG: glycosyltransferase [Smithella sp.]|jgi:dolichol-phosphate mannosyltransferase